MNDTWVLDELRSLANEQNRAGMARFGIDVDQAFGIRMPVLRNLAKVIGKDQGLAMALWASGYHEARILAGMVSDPEQVTEQQLEGMVAHFNSWDLCDQTCMNLIVKMPCAFEKAQVWAGRWPEFEKRAGFVMMACLAVHDKKASNQQFADFFPLLLAHCADNRNFVKKAVNWAVRQIGKRNATLNNQCVELSAKMFDNGSPAAKWIANDALRELTSEAVQTRLMK